MNSTRRPSSAPAIHQALRNFLCLLAGLLSQLCPAQPRDPALELALRKAHDRWIQAVSARDAAAWANAITKHRQVITRNTLISQGLAFPRDVWSGLPPTPALERLRLLEAQAVGETAHLLYFGSLSTDSDNKAAEPNLLLLKFFFERDQWRFDSLKIISLLSKPELREQLRNDQQPAFLDEPMFTPPGKPPAVPPLCQLPDYITGCTVTCPGWEVLLKVNGQEHFAADGRLKFFIQGGLRKGENRIEVEAKPIEPPSDPQRDLQIDFFPKPEPGGKVTRVLHLSIKEANQTRPRFGQWTLSMPNDSTLELELP
jgi:hypothetical protein